VRTVNAVATRKPTAQKQTQTPPIYSQDGWKVLCGRLVPAPGRPREGDPLFSVVGEKLPFDALEDIWRDLRDNHPRVTRTGIYMAHDSMGQVRYVGRGQVFNRLRARKRAQSLELVYFSFYLGMNKTHEREIETVLIRALGAQAYFNIRKKREDIVPGDVRDYEPRTAFYERQYMRGRRPTAARRSRLPRR